MTVRATGLLIVGALLSCGGDDAPTGPVIPVASGVYDGTAEIRGFTFFPEESGIDFEVTIDRDASRVEVRYVQGGTPVVEYWSITAIGHD